MKNYNKWLLSSLTFVALCSPSPVAAVAASGGNYALTKALVGASGVNSATSADYSAAYAVGEDISGTDSHDTEYDLLTGYLSSYPSGYVGPFSLVHATIGTTHILQDGLQVGVPVNATITLDFSSPLDATTIANGIQSLMVMDHLGQPQNSIVPSTFTYDVSGTTVTFSAQTTWPGNTLIDLVANNALQSIDGFTLAQPAHTPFITVLDPTQENVVLNPIPIPTSWAQTIAINRPHLNLDIPVGSLTDYAYVLVSEDPVHAPLQIDPTLINSANAKAQGTGGAYESPLALTEVAAYNTQGAPMSLGKAMSYTITSSGSGFVTGSGVSIRPQTLSLWTLDAAHALWVKMPDSQPEASGAVGAVTEFSVFALMGSADQDASSVYVYPLPWRPQGPNAGVGSGQTGTQADGIHFANLPSECTIKIYTPSGRLVREIHHSDLAGTIGQEKWDGNTSSGDHAASGVYLWRVESSSDSKNGKLIVIR